ECLGRHEPHVCSGDRLANGLSVCSIVPLPLDVRLHVGRRHQTHRMPQRFELARPMMRRSAGFDADEARRQPLKEWQNVPALELTANDYITCRVNSVDLKNRLGDIETNCRDRLHVWLLRIVGALTAPTSMALPCRWRSRPQHQYRTFGRLTLTMLSFLDWVACTSSGATGWAMQSIRHGRASGFSPSEVLK